MGPIPLTWNEALSGVSGSISLAAWIFLLVRLPLFPLTFPLSPSSLPPSPQPTPILPANPSLQVPQLIENYRQSSADGISLTFLLVWMIGDITNLAGALWARLVPTVIALAVYFCFADAILISQCVYYNTLNARRERRRSEAQALREGTTPTEEDALLGGQDGYVSARPQTERTRTSSSGNIGLPGSHRRRSSARSKRSSHDAHRDGLAGILEEEDGSGRRAWIKNAISVILIVVAGVAGWAIAWRAGAWRPTPIGEEESAMPVGAEVLGYVSAVAYLGARIPQIVKNYREKSCEGLSLLFFLLSVLGNVTYGAGVSFTFLFSFLFSPSADGDLLVVSLLSCDQAEMLQCTGNVVGVC